MKFVIQNPNTHYYENVQRTVHPDAADHIRYGRPDTKPAIPEVDLN